MYAHCDGRLRHARREWSMEPLHGIARLCMSRLKNVCRMEAWKVMHILRTVWHILQSSPHTCLCQ